MSKILIIISFFVILLAILGLWYYAATNSAINLTYSEKYKKAEFPIVKSFFLRCHQPDEKKYFQQIIISPEDFSLKTSLEKPLASPIVVSGKATGSWYFEAVFIAEIRDASGRLIGQGQMVAQKDWLTTEMVPFSGTISFSRPQTNSGFLIFKKTNPSTLAEKQKQLTYFVNFKTNR